MNSIRKYAIFSGTLLLLMAIVAGYYIGYHLPNFYESSALELSNELMAYKKVLLGLVITILLDFIVSYTLYKFFELTNSTLSMISGIIRFLYSIIFSIAAWFLFSNLETNISNSAIQNNFQMFQN